MKDAAANLEFEEAARLRDEIKRLQETELALADDPMARQSEVEDRSGGYQGKRRYGGNANVLAQKARSAGGTTGKNKEARSGAAATGNEKTSTRAEGDARPNKRRVATKSRQGSKKSSAPAQASERSERSAVSENSKIRKNSLDEMTVKRTEVPVGRSTVGKPGMHGSGKPRRGR